MQIEHANSYRFSASIILQLLIYRICYYQGHTRGHAQLPQSAGIIITLNRKIVHKHFIAHIALPFELRLAPKIFKMINIWTIKVYAVFREAHTVTPLTSYVPHIISTYLPVSESSVQHYPFPHNLASTLFDKVAGFIVRIIIIVICTRQNILSLPLNRAQLVLDPAPSIHATTLNVLIREANMIWPEILWPHQNSHCNCSNWCTPSAPLFPLGFHFMRWVMSRLNFFSDFGPEQKQSTYWLCTA